MKSLEYLEEIKYAYYLSDNDLDDILDYLRYIARDNEAHKVDSFLEDIQIEIEGGK